MTGGSATVLTPGPGNPATGDPPVTTVTSKPVFGQRRGDPAGAREMADAEQMLDIEEERAAASFGRLPFPLEQLLELVDAA